MTDQDPELAALARIPDEDLVAAVAVIKGGMATPGEAVGFGPEALTAVEAMAFAYYKARHFAQAAALCGFVIQMDVRRASAWRALGACAQAQKDYGNAVRCYRAT